MVAVLAAIEFQEDETNDETESSAESLSPRFKMGRGASAPSGGLWHWIWTGLKRLVTLGGELLTAGLYASVIVALGSRLVGRFTAGDDPVVEARVHLFPVGEPS